MNLVMAEFEPIPQAKQLVRFNDIKKKLALNWYENKKREGFPYRILAKKITDQYQNEDSNFEITYSPLNKFLRGETLRYKTARYICAYIWPDEWSEDRWYQFLNIKPPDETSETPSKTANIKEPPKSIPQPFFEQDSAVKPVEVEPQYQQPSSPYHFDMPYPKMPYFTGRQGILEELHRRFRSSGVGCNIQAISGLGGIGKTTLAVEYIDQAQSEAEPRYQQVFWIKAADKESLRQDLALLAQVLQLSGIEDDNWDHQIRSVQLWLNDSTHDKWLLVFDNADEPKILKPYLPRNRRGHVLITSRASVFDMIHVAEPIMLEQLTPAEARAFFEKRLRCTFDDLEPDEHALAEQLANKLGYLPLALEQAGAYLARHGRIRDYLNQYCAKGISWIEKKPPATGDYPTSVAKTWQINFEVIAKDHPASADVLNISAFLSPDDIPFYLFTEGAAALGGLIAEKLSDTSAAELLFSELLEPLRQYSLIQGDPAQSVFSIHRLVQQVIRESDEMNSVTQASIIEHAAEAIKDVYPADFPQNIWKHYQRYATLLIHASSLFAYAVKNKMKSHAMAILANRIGLHFDYMGNFNVAYVSYTHAFEMLPHSSNIPIAAHMAIINNATQALQKKGDYQSADNLANVLLRFVPKMGASEIELYSNILNNIAALAIEKEDYRTAIEFLRLALDIKQKIKGKNSPKIITIQNNLALCYSNLGHYSEAEKLFKTIVKIVKQNPKSLYAESLTTLGNLAHHYKRQGKFDKTESYLQEVLKLQQSFFSQDSSRRAITLNNLARLYCELGRFSEALSYYKQALDLSLEIFGDKNPTTAKIYSNIGDTLEELDHPEDAEKYHIIALQIRKDVLGKKHPDVVVSYNNLGKYYIKQERMAEAEPVLQTGLNIGIQLFEERHPYLIQIFHKLTFIYRNQGRHWEAKQIALKILHLEDGMFSKAYAENAAYFSTLMLIHYHLSQQQKAEHFHKLALQNIMEAVKHPNQIIVLSLLNLREFYIMQKRGKEALEKYREVLKIYKNYFGEKHPKVREIEALLKDSDKEIIRRFFPI